MKNRIVFWMSLVLLGACSPSTDYIGTQVKEQLQAKISGTMPDANGAVVVSDVVAVQLEGNKYQGLANVMAYGTPFTVRLEILADRKNVIYEVSGSEWTNFLANAHQSKFKSIDGKLADIAANDDGIFASFPITLAKVKVHFAERLQVVLPVDRIGNYIFGRGCKAHACGADEAAWIIDTTTGKGWAVVKTLEMLPGMKPIENFSVYGDSIEHLPRPLLEWAIDSGMTTMNSVLIRPDQN